MEKKTYPFWDGDIGQAVDIDYQGTETLFGLETYEFSYTVKDEPIEVAEGIPGTYDNIVTSGSTARPARSSNRAARTSSGSSRTARPALDIQLTDTDDSVKEAVDEAKTARRLTHHPAHRSLPIVGFGGGLLCLLGGFLA